MSADVGADGRETEGCEVGVGSIGEVPMQCWLYHCPQEA